MNGLDWETKYIDNGSPLQGVTYFLDPDDFEAVNENNIVINVRDGMRYYCYGNITVIEYSVGLDVDPSTKKSWL